MWLEFYNAPLDKDIALISDVSLSNQILAFFYYSEKIGTIHLLLCFDG